MYTMPIKDAFIAELKHESELTRKMLERVPLDQKDWKPHEKSMTIGRLATHIAELPHWISDIIHIDDYDFAKDFQFKPVTAGSSQELMEIFQTYLDKAINDLSSMSDEDFARSWTVGRGGHIIARMPKSAALRGWGYSHLIHHRGQLSVFLRLLDVAVPGMYGPSADEK